MNEYDRRSAYIQPISCLGKRILHSICSHHLAGKSVRKMSGLCEVFVRFIRREIGIIVAGFDVEEVLR